MKRTISIVLIVAALFSLCSWSFAAADCNVGLPDITCGEFADCDLMLRLEDGDYAELTGNIPEGMYFDPGCGCLEGTPGDSAANVTFMFDVTASGAEGVKYINHYLLYVQPKAEPVSEEVYQEPVEESNNEIEPEPYVEPEPEVLPPVQPEQPVVEQIPVTELQDEPAPVIPEVPEIMKLQKAPELSAVQTMNQEQFQVSAASVPDEQKNDPDEEKKPEQEEVKDLKVELIELNGYERPKKDDVNDPSGITVKLTEGEKSFTMKPEDVTKAWTRDDGKDEFKEEFTTFEEGKNYLLTVKFKLPEGFTLKKEAITKVGESVLRFVKGEDKVITIEYYVMNIGVEPVYYNVSFAEGIKFDPEAKNPGNQNQKVEAHNYALTPDEPVAEDEEHPFDRWCSDKELTKAFDFDAVITEDVTVYAKFAEPEHEHTVEKTEAKDATCEEDGNIEYWTCTECGKIFKDEALTEEIELEDTVIPALDHEWGEWTVVKEAKCTEKGTEQRVCKHDEKHVETRDIEALGHHYETTVVAPKCEELGYTLHTCSRCKDSYKDTYVDAIGHNWGEWQIVQRSTCTQMGKKIRYCQNDKTHYETESIALADHQWGPETIQTPATGTTPGVSVKECTVCHKTMTTTIPATGGSTGGNTGGSGGGSTGGSTTTHVHRLSRVPARDATCTSTGSVEYYICNSCGRKFSDSTGTNEIYTTDTPSLGHNWSDWRTTKAATTESDGIKERVCARCGTKETDRIAKLTSGSSGSGTVYQFTEGNNTNWKKGSEEGIKIVTDSIAKKLVSVYVDGEILSVRSYKTNGTVENMNKPSEVTLLTDYLEKLEKGDHTIDIQYSDGKASGKFRIFNSDEPTPSPSPTFSPSPSPSPSPTASPKPSDNVKVVDTISPTKKAQSSNPLVKALLAVLALAFLVLIVFAVLYMKKTGKNFSEMKDDILGKIQKKDPDIEGRR